jgi:hypothetical protein
MEEENNQKNDSVNLKDRIKNGLLEEKHPNRSEYVFGIIINLILFYIANNILNWNLSFIAPSFSQVLWAINLAIIVTIVGNILLIAYSVPWFRHLVKAVMNVFGFIAAYVFYTVFPLIFSQSYLYVLAKIILILILIVGFLSILFEIIKMIIGIVLTSKQLD